MAGDSNIESNGDGDSGKCDIRFPMSRYILYLLLDKQSTNCLRHHFYYNIFLCILYCFVFVVGISASLVVILVIACRPRMRNSSNCFIVNMAVASLCSVLIDTPAQVLDNLYSTWLFDGATCKLSHYFQPVFLFASIYSVVAYAADRWHSLCRPLGTRRNFSNSQTGLAIIVIWTAAFLLHMPYLFVYQVAPLSNNNLSSPPSSSLGQVCQEIWQSEIISQLYFLIVSILLDYLVPLIVLIFLVVSIFINVRAGQIPSPQQHHLRTQSTSILVVRKGSRKAGLQIVKMLAAMTFTYFICSLFYNLALLMLKLTSANDMEAMYSVMPLVHLAHFSGNSFLHSVLFGMMHDNFLDVLCPNRSISSCRDPRLQYGLDNGGGGGGSLVDIGMMEVRRGTRRGREGDLEWEGEEQNSPINGDNFGGDGGGEGGLPPEIFLRMRPAAVALPGEGNLAAVTDF